ALECAEAAGLVVRLLGFASPDLGARCEASAVLVSTVPSTAIADRAEVLGRAPFVLDAIYDPWPTPLARAVQAAGGVIVGGLAMLLNQAYGQVEQFTGLPAPRAEMAAALA
ncbi:MAG: shikimate dehydrogenase, partial [Rhodococcus sp. (in: high G+C Gram-positive bacteria)]